MNWDESVARVTPYIVKIETPAGHGTGFLCLYNQDRSLYGIATALHVVDHADNWQEPIRLRHFPSGTSVFLKEPVRHIFCDSRTDSAVIVTPPESIRLPEDTLPLLPTDSSLPIGADVGWLGFPGIADSTLCFFSGNISARQDWLHAYLIDGVAINGVSGGPVFFSKENEGVQIIGIISAYVSNRATGDTLPGLSIARDVSHFHDTISKMKSLDEAREQRKKVGEGTQSSIPAPETATHPPSENADG
jgi:hypothetical protein